MNFSKLFPEYYTNVYWNTVDRIKKRTLLFGGRSSVKGTTAYTIAILDVITPQYEIYDDDGNSTGKFKDNENYGKDIVVYVPSKTNIKDYSFSQVQNVLNRLNLVFTTSASPYEILIDTSGSRVIFKGMDVNNSKKSVSNFKGVETVNGIAHCIFDELDTSNDSGIVSRISTIEKSLIRFNSSYWYIFNPPRNKSHWIFEFLEKLKQKDSLVVKSTIYDLLEEEHQFVSDVTLKEAELDKVVDLKSWEHEWMGLAVGLDGLFFQDYDRDNITISSFDKMKIKYNFVGIDYGEQNPTTFVWWALTKGGNVIRLSLYRYSGRETKKEKGVVQYAEDFYEWYEKNKKLWGKCEVVLIDPSAKALKIEIEKQGNAPIEKGNNSRVFGWSIVKGFMRAKKFFNLDLPEMEHAHKEYENAEYDLNTIEKSKLGGEDCKKINDHIMDADRMVLVEIKTRWM